MKKPERITAGMDEIKSIYLGMKLLVRTGNLFVNACEHNTESVLLACGMMQNVHNSLCAASELFRDIFGDQEKADECEQIVCKLERYFAEWEEEN